MSVPTFDPVRVPMNFRCGDRMIRDLSTLPILSQTSETDTRCIKNTIRYAVTDTLELEIHTTRWLAYNAYEWYGCFVNTGSDNSPVVSDVNTADIGQIVNFMTIIHVAAGAENYAMHDKMSAGLTFLHNLSEYSATGCPFLFLNKV